MEIYNVTMLLRNTSMYFMCKASSFPAPITTTYEYNIATELHGLLVCGVFLIQTGRMRCVSPDEINWPEGEDAPPPDAQELITVLLRQNPLERMGAGTNAQSKENVAQPVPRPGPDRPP